MWLSLFPVKVAIHANSNQWFYFSLSDLLTHSRFLHTSIGCGQVSKMAPVSGSPMEVVEQRIKDNKVMVFSKTTCPFCTKIKNLFDSLGFKYEVLELDQLGKLSSIFYHS